jgi:hypothetical protein
MKAPEQETPAEKKARLSAEIARTPSWESFISAFRDRASSCRETCNCGREFYNPGNGWDWEFGEIEALEAVKATPLNYAVQRIRLEGCIYVEDCDCWHERALRIIGFINRHNYALADFLTLEKTRKQLEADRSPVVK